MGDGGFKELMVFFAFAILLAIVFAGVIAMLSMISE
jgi:hypothetical protein